MKSMEPASTIIGRASILKLLREYCAPKTISKGESLSTVLEQCIRGDKSSCDRLERDIEQRKQNELFDAFRIEQSNSIDQMEENVSKLLPVDRHPCHNLTETGGDIPYGCYRPSKSYPFARRWLDEGNLRKEVEGKFQPLLDGLAAIKAETDAPAKL
jgi:hypothetical protein